MEAIIEDRQSFTFIMRELNLLPQLYHSYLLSQEECTICLPSEKYYRTTSYRIFLFVSEYYAALIRNTPPIRECSFCINDHDRGCFCLPCEFSLEAVEILLDLLEFQQTSLSFEDTIVSFVRLCGYILVKERVLFAFLKYRLPRGTVTNSSVGPLFVKELYRQGFIHIAKFYACAISPPGFNDFLRQCPSYPCVENIVYPTPANFAFNNMYALQQFAWPITDHESCHLSRQGGMENATDLYIA